MKKSVLQIISFLIALIFFVTSCGSFYVSRRENPMQMDTYDIRATGGSEASEDRVFLTGFVKCAETAIRNNYQWFYLLNYKTNINTSNYYLKYAEISKHNLNMGIRGIYGISKTYDFHDYVMPKYRHSIQFLIKIVDEPEEDEYIKPYQASLVIERFKPTLVRIEGEDTGIQITRTLVVIIVIILGGLSESR